MKTDMKQNFDFSLDAALFQKRLLKRLQDEKMKMAAIPLTDDELGYVNAAGMPKALKTEEECGKDDLSFLR